MFSNVPCRCFESGAVTPTHSSTIRSPDPRPHRTKGQKNRFFSRPFCPSPRLSPGEPDRPESPSRAQPHALRRWAWMVGRPRGPRIDLQEPEIKTPGHGAGPVGGIELGEDRRDVRLHGSLGDSQPVADL